MAQATVLDASGQELSPCSEARARALVLSGKAALVSDQPTVIRLYRPVAIPPKSPPQQAHMLEGKRVLLHICCGPCATYVVQRLREHGAFVTGHWYNPNIQPFSEHERRREALAQLVSRFSTPEADLHMVWETYYGMEGYFRAVVGHERFRERCLICYRMRLERTVSRAAKENYDFVTTTLLISPYQDQDAIRRLGEELSQAHGVRFYFENFRRGFSEHHRLAKEYELYRQRYCGCVYSEWEALDRRSRAK